MHFRPFPVCLAYVFKLRLGASTSRCVCLSVYLSIHLSVCPPKQLLNFQTSLFGNPGIVWRATSDTEGVMGYKSSAYLTTEDLWRTYEK